jgi:long-chain acyl-CoA synthetase
MNFAIRIELNARNTPHDAAFHFEDHTYSWRELNRDSDRFAGFLHEHGFAPGDTLAIYMPNVPEFVIAFYGAMKAGVIAMPMNTRFAAEEIKHMLDHVGHRGLVTLSRYNDLTKSLDLDEIERVVVAGGKVPTDIGANTHRFDDILVEQPAGFDTIPRQNDSPAFYMHTSGTTGRPKPVIATHENVRAHALGYIDRLELSRSDVALNIIPIFHVGGLNLHLTLFTQLGAPQVLVDGWDVETALAAIEEHEVTYAFLISTMLYDLSNYDGDTYNTESLSVVGAGGQNVPAPVVERFEEQYGGQVLEAYGLTETMPAVLSNAPDDRRLGTAGKPIENAAVTRIVDPEDSETECGPGELGELLVSGDVVSPGYLDRPAANDEAFETDPDGTRWLRTGDIVQYDEEGYVSIEDRVDNMIITGSENVYPNKIEEQIYDIDGVEEAIVAGEPHDRFGEQVVAIIVANDSSLTEQEVIEQFDANDSLAKYKHPRRIIIVDELPRSGAGKIDRQQIETEYLD